MLKKLFHFIIAVTALIVIILSGLSFYINHFFLPEHGKELILTQIGNMAGTKVFFKNASYDFFSGLVIENLVIPDPSGKNKNLFSAKKIEIKIFVPDFINNNLIIKKLKITSPEIFIRKKSGGKTSLSSLKIAPNTLISPYIFFKDGTIHFEDHDSTPAQTFKISGIKGLLSTSLRGVVSFEIHASYGSSKNKNVLIAGTHSIVSNKTDLKVLAKKISLKQFNKYLKEKFGVLILSGEATINTSIKIENFLRYLIEGSLVLNKLKAGDKNVTFSGSPSVAAVIGFTGGKNTSFEGTIKTENSTLSFKEQPGTLENFSGTFSFDKTGFDSDNLGFSLDGQQFKGKVKADDFKNPSCGLYLFTSICDNWNSNRVLKKYFPIGKNMAVTGDADVELWIDNKRDGTKYETQKCIIDLKGVEVLTRVSQRPFKNVAGKLIYENKSFTTHHLTGNYIKDFSLKGEATQEKCPNIRFDAVYNDNKILADFVLYPDSTTINSLQIIREKTNIDISGEITNPAKPDYRLTVSGNTNFKEISKILPALQLGLSNPEMETINFNGIVEGNGGKLEGINCSDIQFSIKKLSYENLKVEDFSGTLKYIPGKLTLNFISGNFYHGKAKGKMTFDLNRKWIPLSFYIESKIKNLELNEFLKDFLEKNKKIWGKTDFSITFAGVPKNPSTFKGKGSFNIANGRLWDMDLFKGIWQILVLNNPSLKKAVFTSVSSTFTIGSERVYFPDAMLESRHMVLIPEGYINFDRSINFVIGTEFYQEDDDTTPAKIAKGLGNLKGKFSTIRAAGTIEKPKLTTELKPLEKILEIN